MRFIGSFCFFESVEQFGNRCGGIVVCRCQLPEFSYGAFKTFCIDGFKQVVDAVYFEGFQCIFVVGSCKNDRTADIYFFKNGERRSIG